MKKLILIIFLIIGITSCALKVKKPFIITSKKPEDKLIKYTYKNGRGNIGIFWETYDKYQIGDTIK